MENLGIDPSTSRMQSERSIIWANSPIAYCFTSFWSEGSYTSFDIKYKAEKWRIWVSITVLLVC